MNMVLGLSTSGAALTDKMSTARFPPQECGFDLMSELGTHTLVGRPEHEVAYPASELSPHGPLARVGQQYQAHGLFQFALARNQRN